MASLDTVELRDRIGTLSVQQIRDLSGNAPCYLYERTRIVERIEALRAAMPPDLKLAYSLKANPFPPLVGIFLNRLDGADVTSRSEMVEAFNAGARPDRIMFAGPAKKPDELRCAVAIGANICVESLREIGALADIATEMGRQARVMLRVNPQFSLSGASMRMGGAPTQFGLDVEDLADAWAALESPALQFCGIHIYWGSQCLSAEAINEAQTASVDLIETLAPAFPRPPELLNLGGGFGIPYFAKDTPLDLTELGRNFAPLFDRLRAGFGGAEIFLELGRYLVGEAGTYVCNVVDKKSSHGVDFIVTDGGMHHFLAASGNLGQKIRRNYPICVLPASARPAEGDADSTVQIVGALCTPIDLLGHRLAGPQIEVGDMIGILCAGAYGLTASPLGFLSHPRPGEFII